MQRFLRKLRYFIRLFGFSGLVLFSLFKLTRKKLLFKKHLNELDEPVWVRIGTTDPYVFFQIFWERQYDYVLPRKPKVIVDAGAYTGLSTVFFANKYPDARIVAVEPEKSNFEMLRRNTSAYPQISIVQAALWNRDGQVYLEDSGDGNHGFRIHQAPCSNVLVRSITLNTLMMELHLDSIDLLKIDIEGAEKEIFENCSDWIVKVGGLMVELHDNIKPWCSRAFIEATKDFPLAFTKGETIMRFRTE